MKVPWTARRSNQSILKEISPEYSLEGLMLKLNLQYFGHLLRRTDSSEKTLMEGFPGGSTGKESACNAGDLCSIPGLGRSPGEGNSYSLKYSGLENPHGQRSPEGYSPRGHKESDMAVTKQSIASTIIVSYRIVLLP